MAFKMKGSHFDFNSKNQGLNKAKAKARTYVADKISKKKDASLMEKGKELNEASKEINKYTDY